MSIATCEPCSAWNNHDQPNVGEDEEPSHPCSDLVTSYDSTGSRQIIIEGRVIGNCRSKADSGGGTVLVPTPIGEILQQITEVTNGWPCRIGNLLFVDDSGISYFEKQPSLFGWLGRSTGKPPRFANRPGFHTKGEVFAELQRTATNYQAVETFPHEPLMPDHYYGCCLPDPGDGSTLAKLLDFFSPETEIDRHLIAALFATPLWGGPPGCRPVFCIVADSGRGSGKTSCANAVARLYGGSVDVSRGESFDQIKKRLLTPAALSMRVLSLDNLKVSNFSWAELESMVTSPTISGNRNYCGNADRPNTLTATITQNTASMGRDMAQRCIIIKLTRPRRSGDWKERLDNFIDNNREQIFGDLIGLLRSETHHLVDFTRWSTWERAVLQRFPTPTDIQRVIVERQSEIDCEGEENDLISECFERHLLEVFADCDRRRIHVPSSLAATWLNEATGENHGQTKATQELKQRIKTNELRQLAENPCNTYGRGFVWTGKDASPSEKVTTDLRERLNNPNRPRQ